MPDWQRWQDEIATTIANSTTIQDAAANLGLWAKRAAEDESIAGGIYSAAMQADLAGQLFVRQVEVPESMPERALADKSAAAFFSLPFDEAVQEFLSKRIVTPEEFRRLSDAARTRAFTATYLASDGLREHAFELLAKALQEGSTLRDFAAQLQAGEVSLGVTPSSPAYIETVYRTNIQSAYGAGRYRQITNPVVVAARPYIEYRTAQDSRVRPSHALLDGVIFEQSDPNWSRYAPPNGYNCFSAGTLVQGKAVAALRAWYAGELVELTTESGRRLTVTPNHPLATCNGFVPAGSIREGEEVFAYRDGVDGSLVGGVDPQDAPVKIEEVFDALAVRNGPAARLGACAPRRMSQCRLSAAVESPPGLRAGVAGGRAGRCHLPGLGLLLGQRPGMVPQRPPHRAAAVPHCGAVHRHGLYLLAHRHHRLEVLAMCMSSPSPPAVPPPPAPPPDPPTAVDESVQAARNDERKKAINATGARSTILTSGSGLTTAAATDKKTLLGQ